MDCLKQKHGTSSARGPSHDMDKAVDQFFYRKKPSADQLAPIGSAVAATQEAILGGGGGTMSEGNFASKLNAKVSCLTGHGMKWCNTQ